MPVDIKAVNASTTIRLGMNCPANALLFLVAIVTISHWFLSFLNVNRSAAAKVSGTGFAPTWKSHSVQKDMGTLDKIKVSDDVSIGGQPTEADLKELQELGFKSVVNLRMEGEKNQPMSPDEEDEKVHELEMQYLHIPISMDTIGSSHIEQFREEYQRLALPAYVHCAGGTRAGALVMMDQAVKDGISGDEALKRAEELGVNCDSPKIRQLITSYVDCKNSEAR
jgi:uncharacterized protein (TIGR01244 family)